MKLLVVCSGSDFSTKDVEDNLIAGLRELGHEVGRYDLRTRLSRSYTWLRHNWERAVVDHPELPEPDLGDFCYDAGLGVIEVALRHVPDWVVVVTGVLLHPDILTMLKRAGVPLAVLLTESPYNDESQVDLVRRADIAWTNERTSVPTLRAAMPEVHYLPHAYVPSKHRPDGDDTDVPAHDVVFVGSAFPERIATLGGVDWSGIDLGLYGNWEDLPAGHPLWAHVRGDKVDNDYAAALYRRARIGLNLYREPSLFPDAESLNPRAYELAACGAFHLSEYRAEVEEVFGDLVPTFAGPEGLEWAVRRWLRMDLQREYIAGRLPCAVAGHTWRERASRIVAGLRATAPRQPERMVAATAAS